MARTPRRRGLGQAPVKDPALRQFLDEAATLLETGLGLRPKQDQRERFVTVRDLEALRLAQLSATGAMTPGPGAGGSGGNGGGSGGGGGGAGGGGSGGGSDDTTPPPTPTGLVAVGAITTILLSWDQPQNLYRNHALTEIWRASVDDLNEAVRVGTSPSFIWADELEDDGEATRFYWIRFVSTADVTGPFNSLAGTSATTTGNIDAIVDEVQERVRQSPLFAELERLPEALMWLTLVNERHRLEGSEVRGRIAHAEQTLTTVETDLQAEAEARLLLESQFGDNLAVALDQISTLANEQLASAEAVTLLGAQVDSNTALIEDAQQAIATESSARASAITTLQSEVDGATAIVQQHAASIDGMLGKWVVTMDVNGHASGFGMMNDGQTSDFIVRADRFAIAHPGATSAVPFVVEGGKVYMDGAVIKNASIGTAQIGTAVIEGAHIKDAAIVAAKIGDGEVTNAKIGNVLQSVNYVAGSSGWAILKSGYVELNNAYLRGNLHSENAYVRGDVEATSIKVDVANVVSTLHLQGQAVTIPVGAYVTGPLPLTIVDYPTDPWTTVASGVIDASGAPHQIWVRGNVVATWAYDWWDLPPLPGDAWLLRVRLVINGVPLWTETLGDSRTWAVEPPWRYQPIWMRQYTPSAGAKTYALQLQAYRASPGAAALHAWLLDYYDSGFIVLETKR